MNRVPPTTSALLALSLAIGGCAESEEAPETPVTQGDHALDDHGHDDDHHHGDETPIGTATIGDVEAEVSQSHGDLAAGKVLAIAVKLPDSQGGDVKVRAWVGTEDRSGSDVGEGVYASAHDDYDIHVDTPDPLPAGAKWWIEVEYPDGRTELGSIEAR